MFRIVLFSLSCLVSTFVGAVAVVGRECPDFQMTDIEGQKVSLEGYRGKIIVLEWTNPACPYVLKQYSKDTNDGVGNMQAMQKRFTKPAMDVVWLLISSATPGIEGYLNAEQWKEQIQKWGASPTAVLIDEGAELARMFGASRTPEVCVIGKDGVLLYRGAVDSLRGTDPYEIEYPSNLPWLKYAVENAIRGRRVFPPETIPYGCPIR